MFPITYKNGNVNVTLHEDGTKIDEWPDGEEKRVDMPSSADCKITNYCNLSHICQFCHEMSDKTGEHCDMDILQDALNDAIEGMELAIGGGNPLSHPRLHEFLLWCKGRKIIPNLTVNSLHLRPYRELLQMLQRESLFYGLGISYRGKDSFSLPRWLDYGNVVFHLILGIHDIEDCRFIEEECRKRNITPKILLLGYKTWGNGKAFFNPTIKKALHEWKSDVETLYEEFTGVLCFDNLAIEQTELKTCLPKHVWDQFYCGDDGVSTYYLDAVNQVCARTSTSAERYPFSSTKEMFDKVRV